MRPSRVIRNLSLKLLRSSTVVPLPIPTLFDQKICQELEALKSRDGENFNMTSWLPHALESLIATQKIAQECLATVVCKDSDRDAINSYLEDNIELLDTCNSLLEITDVLFNYRETLQVALHMLEGRFESNLIGLARAKEALDVCLTLEKQCREMSKYNSRVKRMNDKLAQRARPCAKNLGSCSEPADLDEILNGSLSIASLVCEVVDTALSFKSKPRVVSVMHKYSSIFLDLQKLTKEETRRGSSSILLRRTVNASQLLREQIKSQNYGEICETVEELKRSCEEFGELLKPFKGKVKHLYRELISFRVALLGTLSSL